MDDALALLGLTCVLLGLYLWLGLAAPLIVGGLVLIYIGVRWEVASPAKTAQTPVQDSQVQVS